MVPSLQQIAVRRLQQLESSIVELTAAGSTEGFTKTLAAVALRLIDVEAVAVYLFQSPGLLYCEAVEVASESHEFSLAEVATQLPSVSLFQEDDEQGQLLCKAYREGRPVVGQHATEEGTDSAAENPLSLFHGMHPRLAVPLLQQGVLLVSSPRKRIFSEEDIALASQLGVFSGSLLRKNRQLEEQRALFEATIQMIAGAVDEKFYLGGEHCRRVPVLTMMLAHAVNKSTQGPFAEHRLDAQELYELEVAAWLHDCGKLVTPISLVEKSRKLETVFDRIDLIQTRFEIVRRDEEIARLRSGMKPEGLAVRANGYGDTQQMLEDLHFLAESNHGSKNMTDEDLLRIQEIAERYRWVNRQMEELSVLSWDEMDNLSIKSGTLNSRERIKINNHSLATISMLDLLPFPDELQRVSDIVAGAAQGVNGEPLLQARILALADVFVSVIASSRHYRKANNLVEALEILCEKRDEGRLDADLLDLFLRERLHQQYAAEFLSEEQGGFSLPE